MFAKMWVTNPFVFYGAGFALMAYLLYITLRPRKGQRPGQEGREPEL